MTDGGVTFRKYLTDAQEYQHLLDSVRRGFRDLPAFCDAMDKVLQEICRALSAEKVLVTGWDAFDQQFRTFWASGFIEDEVVPVPPSEGELSRLVAESFPMSLFDQSVLDRQFGGIARDSAVNAPIWVHGNLQAVLSVLDIDGLHPEEDLLEHLNNLVNEIANVLGEEFDRSLGFGLSQQKLEDSEYCLAHLLHRGEKWVAVIFADLRGSTPATQVLGVRGSFIRNSVGQPVNLPKAAGLIKKYSERMANTLCIHGRIDKFIGDAVMGIVGDLFEEADDQKTVLRAICTATMMYDAFQEIVANWNDPEHEDYWIPEFRKYFNEDINLRLGIGINYGPAIFDFYGSADYREYTGIGDTVNTAERLEEQASKPDELGEDCEPILISQMMFTRAEGFIPDFKRHTLNLRGKALPVSAYGVTQFDRDKCKAEGAQCDGCAGGQWSFSL